MNEWVIRVIWRQYMTTPQRTASSRKLRPSGKRPEKMAAPESRRRALVLVRENSPKDQSGTLCW